MLVRDPHLESRGEAMVTPSGIGNLDAPGIPIVRFAGEHDFLSNFYPIDILADRLVYPTLEHAFQAAKAIKEEDRIYIARLSTPGKAKYWGRRIKCRGDWEEVKIGVMTNLIALKFARGSHLADLLALTGDRELIEGNSWGDRYWGVCRGIGENHLGRILMARRLELRS
jgi:hypothetical protein